MSDLLARATNRLVELRNELVAVAPHNSRLSAALQREISLAEMHVRVLRRLGKARIATSDTERTRHTGWISRLPLSC